MESAIFFLLTTGVIIVLRKSLPSSFKHVLWFIVICGFFCIPLASTFAPSFHIGFFRVYNTRGDASKVFKVMLLAYANITGRTTFSEAGRQFLIYSNSSNGLQWPYLISLVWIAGIIITSLRFITGKIGLMFITKNSSIIRNKQYVLLLKELSKKLRVDRKVMLLRSRVNNGPFTFNLFKSIILLPWDFTEWTDERVEVVLAHELAHIKRKDYLTKSVSRVICTLLWFVPVIWVAYSRLQIEQERACDSLVVAAGTRPSDYADHLVGLLRFARRHFLLASSIFITGLKKRIVQKRISSLLSRERIQHISIVKGAFTLMVLIFCLLPVVMVNPVTAENKTYVAGENEELYGTWIKRAVVKPEGKIEYYATLSDPVTNCSETFTITDKWKDLKGNIWYTCITKSISNKPYYELYRISNSGKTWEAVFSGVDFPETLDPDDILANYRIFYRP
jgi:beta-lactamase regulating signal transducer with metallopeptidase domain